MLLSQHTFGQHLPPSTKTCTTAFPKNLHSSSSQKSAQQLFPKTCTTALPKAWTAVFLFSPSSNTCKIAAAPAALGHAWQHLDQLLDSTTLHARQHLQNSNNTLQHQQ
jgi:hypothetical protein